jgi:hypothetical protein
MARGCSTCAGSAPVVPNVYVQTAAPAASGGAGLLPLLAPVLTLLTSVFSGSGMQIHSGKGNTLYYAIVLLIVYFASRRENGGLLQSLSALI